MKTDKYKILVLSDLKEKSTKVLSYAGKLAYEIDAKVELFHVKDISGITEMENPLSVSREVNNLHNEMSKRINDFVQPISEENNIKIKTIFALGNIKSIIENHIKTSHPDMVILGESKPKRFNWFGDNINKLVHKIYDGVIFEATEALLSDKSGNVSLDNLGLKNNVANYNISKVKAEEKVKV